MWKNSKNCRWNSLLPVYSHFKLLVFNKTHDWVLGITFRLKNETNWTWKNIQNAKTWYTAVRIGTRENFGHLRDWGENVSDLKNAIKDAWDDIDLQIVRKLVMSFPKRLIEVVAAKGGHILKYWAATLVVCGLFERWVDSLLLFPMRLRQTFLMDVTIIRFMLFHCFIDCNKYLDLLCKTPWLVQKFFVLQFTKIMSKIQFSHTSETDFTLKENSIQRIPL